MLRGQVVLGALADAQTKSLVDNNQIHIIFMAQTSTTAFFCTYCNRADTKGEWRKSREYPSIEALLKAMASYLTKYPNTTVTYQTRNVYTLQP